MTNPNLTDEDKIEFEYYDPQNIQYDLKSILLDKKAIQVIQSYVQLFKDNEIARFPILLLKAYALHDALNCCQALANGLESNLIVVSLLELHDRYHTKKLVQNLFEQVEEIQRNKTKLERDTEGEKAIDELSVTVVFTELEHLLAENRVSAIKAFKRLKQTILDLRKFDRTFNVIFIQAQYLFFEHESNTTEASDEITRLVYEYLPVEEQIVIDLPDEELREICIQQALEEIYRPEEKLPDLEEMIQLTEGFSSYQLENFLDRLALRSKTGTLTKDSFKKIVYQAAVYRRAKATTKRAKIETGLYHLPLSRRAIWQDYKDHIAEYLNNQPTSYPDLLQAAKKLADIDHKLRILLYDLTVGGILTEKTPYVKLTDLKRNLENN